MIQYSFGFPLAANPRRIDLLEAVKGSTLPIGPIEEILEQVERIVGGPPAKARLTDGPVAVIK